MTLVRGDWLSASTTQAVLGLLNDAGHEALAVGGCVRNALMGVPVEDVDIATDAAPERVVELAEAAGLRVVPTGMTHGTVTVVAEGQGFEVTSFRRDAETFGRHARVEFGAALDEDAARRDFTMNALYAGADGRVLDPLGGLPDVRARRVRFVGQPGDRIAEDALRILRFFRFLARYGDPALSPDPEALAACAAGVEALRHVSAERVGHEFRKLLGARNPGPAVMAMAEAGVLDAVLPGADAAPLGRLVRLEAAQPGAWLRRLAAMGGRDPVGDLRLSRAEAADLARIALFPGAPPHELGYRLGAGLGRDALLVAAARAGVAALPLGWKAGIDRGAAAEFPLKAADLIPELEGAALGQALAQAEADWIAGNFAPNGAMLRARALAG